MKNLNIYIIALLSSLFLMVSCDKDNEGAKFTPTDDGVTFSAAKHSITVPATESYFDVYIMRANKSGALDVPISVTGASDFVYPSSAKFEDGQAIDTLRFTFGEEVEIGKAYPIVISFDEQYASEITAANNSLAVTFQRDFVYESYGVGSFYEGIINPAYSTGLLNYNVEVDKAIGFEVYRMVNPFGYGVHPYTASSEVKINPCYIMIDARDPNAVFIPTQSMGIDWGDGVMSTGSIYGNLSTNPVYYLGTKVDKTITFGYMYIVIGTYGPYTSNNSKLVLP